VAGWEECDEWDLGVAWRRRFISVLQADAGHALAEAALLDEVFLQAKELLVDQVVGLVDEANRDVGDYGWRAGLDKLAVVLEGQRRLSAQFADILRFLRVFDFPERIL
jgi:hypothetical protein